MPEISQSLIDAKNQVVQFFLDLKAAGIEVLIAENYGGWSLELFESAHPLAYVELTNAHWHPEWTK